jgi:hypothetical protein
MRCFSIGCCIASTAATRCSWWHSRWCRFRLLLLGSPGYLILFVQAFLFPGSERTLWSNPFLIITHLAEMALMLWLLIRGVNAAEWERRAVSSSRA